MRSSKWIPAAVSSLYLVVTSLGQDRVKTDARDDGFSGPIESVISTILLHGIHWRQPDGVALVWPISCRECDYDPDGARVRSGYMNANGFQGDNILLDRDGNGHVSDRRILDASTGDLKVHEVFGTFGMTEQTYCDQGKVSFRRTLSYDPFGRISETASFDSRGQQTEHAHSTYTDKGILTEDSTWGSNGQLEWQTLFDPEKNTESFTTFDDAGIMKLAWTRKDDNTISFWQRSDEENQYGGCLSYAEDKNCARETHCLANNDRVRAVIREQFIEPGSHDLKSAEWRDGDGKLMYAAYYEYERDSQRNWTRRSIWVVSPELQEHTLYEEDTRILVYW